MDQEQKKKVLLVVLLIGGGLFAAHTNGLFGGSSKPVNRNQNRPAAAVVQPVRSQNQQQTSQADESGYTVAAIREEQQRMQSLEWGRNPFHPPKPVEIKNTDQIKIETGVETDSVVEEVIEETVEQVQVIEKVTPPTPNLSVKMIFFNGTHRMAAISKQLEKNSVTMIIKKGDTLEQERVTDITRDTVFLTSAVWGDRTIALHNEKDQEDDSIKVEAWSY